MKNDVDRKLIKKNANEIRHVVKATNKQAAGEQLNGHANKQATNKIGGLTQGKETARRKAYEVCGRGHINERK